MSVDDEYHAHKRREEARYVLAFDEFEKNLTPDQRRVLGSAAVPDVEDPRSHSSRRVSLGVLTDAAERVSASYTPNVTEAVDGTLENPSSELLAEMLGIPLKVVTGGVLEDLNPTPELLAEKLGVSLDVAQRIFDWHNAAAARNAERIKMRAIVRIAGVFLDCSNTKLSAAGLTFAGGLALQYGIGSLQDYAASIDVSRAAITKNVKFWQGELDLPERLAPELRHPNLSEQTYLLFQKLAFPSEPKLTSGVRGILAWHSRASARKAEKIKVRAIERIVGGVSGLRELQTHGGGACLCERFGPHGESRNDAGLRAEDRGLASGDLQERKILAAGVGPASGVQYAGR